MQSQQSGLLCSSEVRNTKAAVCALDVTAGTQLYISVNGPTRADYSLVYRDNVAQVTPPTPSQSSAPDASAQGTNLGENSDADQSDGGLSADTVVVAQMPAARSGGGSVTLFLLFCLLILVIDRSYSGVKRRD